MAGSRGADRNLDENYTTSGLMRSKCYWQSQKPARTALSSGFLDSRAYHWNRARFILARHGEEAVNRCGVSPRGLFWLLRTLSPTKASRRSGGFAQLAARYTSHYISGDDDTIQLANRGRFFRRESHPSTPRPYAKVQSVWESSRG